MAAPNLSKNILTNAQAEALLKVYKFADVEETGKVDVATIITLAVQLMGPNFSEAEKESVCKKAEARAEKGMLSYTNFLNIMLETMSMTTQWGGKLKTQVDGYVGFDSIQEQIRLNSLKRGFEFNVMVVGCSGLGKSTLINTLFKTRASRTSCTPENSEIPKTVEIKSVTHVLEEKGVNLKLTVTDTPGFGDQINNKNCWDPVLGYINRQYDIYLNEEISINRRMKIPDNRVHCCLYFIAPTGHRLKPLDILVMKHLDKCVNVIPVIAKADTLTLEEREAFKKRIREDVQLNNLNIYPIMHSNLTEEEIKFNNKVKEQIPFAVVGSDRYVSVGSKNVLGRKTKWGIIEVENRAHCEFPLLRDLLIKTHMEDMIEVTKAIHYENYRRLKLAEKMNQGSPSPAHSTGEVATNA
ncbi:neuronal-specific septin-3-like [Clytia hemisphaerica]|uniref:Septin-type G domain-containing protein n=1 Tax=Clytia hemisphaerica TaxID=252671 RepID=A0A7M5UYD1_9CNID|eukprot:TCONS_00062836-protein